MMGQSIELLVVTEIISSQIECEDMAGLMCLLSIAEEIADRQGDAFDRERFLKDCGLDQFRRQLDERYDGWV